MVQVALICGAAGFIGQHTTNYFVSKGWSVAGAGHSRSIGFNDYPEKVPYFTGDFGDRFFCQQLLDKEQPSHIIYLASPADIAKSFADPFADFCKQTQPLFSILEASRKLTPIPKFLLVSSAAIYGNPSCLPVSESAQPSPISPYGFHKLQQELIADEFFKLFDLPICKARIFSTFGEGLKKLAVWEITRRALQNDFSIEGSGNESRDYLYVEDIANALYTICSNSPFQGEVINVASGSETQIKTLSHLIYNSLKIENTPQFTGNINRGTPQKWRADIEYLKSLGFHQSISLEVGISKTIKWINNNF
ncbi:NAD-dependent epimerase/dehydratase family protein [Pseudanabaena mucicola]|uniref:NAD-dependent epimerase/dehydratase family protein n=1 Tax=Pseudanabaena mucicola FACHB-723 TaxID=2692860 RepID=A0ABR7ZTK8_9CYAN|nr:NAD-dependent epimerase/dehydratase family protein [Pseudanabaena mucicola]MBD2187097.1 NAD-dependent epimerase/dehydratase family protein [Pseudanabaena mucicola FACHB-723]